MYCIENILSVHVLADFLCIKNKTLLKRSYSAKLHVCVCVCVLPLHISKLDPILSLATMTTHDVIPKKTTFLEVSIAT